MGGDIWAEPNDPRGTSIHFTALFPLPTQADLAKLPPINAVVPQVHTPTITVRQLSRTRLAAHELVVDTDAVSIQAQAAMATMAKNSPVIPSARAMSGRYASLTLPAQGGDSVSALSSTAAAGATGSSTGSGGTVRLPLKYSRQANDSPVTPGSPPTFASPSLLNSRRLGGAAAGADAIAAVSADGTPAGAPLKTTEPPQWQPSVLGAALTCLDQTKVLVNQAALKVSL